MSFEDYDVEKILGERKKGNTTQYLVQWKASWEDASDLNCKELIKEFKEEKGEKNVVNGNAENGGVAQRGRDRPFYFEMH